MDKTRPELRALRATRLARASSRECDWIDEFEARASSHSSDFALNVDPSAARILVNSDEPRMLLVGEPLSLACQEEAALWQIEYRVSLQFVIESAQVHRPATLDFGDELSVGTHPDNDIVVHPESNLVSRYHAKVRLDDTGLIWLEDHSTNGTWVNGMPIESNVEVLWQPDSLAVLGDDDPAVSTSASLTVRPANLDQLPWLTLFAFGARFRLRSEFLGDRDFETPEELTSWLKEARNRLETPEMRAETLKAVLTPKWHQALARAEQQTWRRNEALFVRKLELEVEKENLAKSERQLERRLDQLLNAQQNSLRNSRDVESHVIYQSTLFQDLHVEISQLNPCLKKGGGAFLLGLHFHSIPACVSYLREQVALRVSRWAESSLSEQARERREHLADMRSVFSAVEGFDPRWFPDLEIDESNFCAGLSRIGSREIASPDFDGATEGSAPGYVWKSSVSLLVSTSMLMLLSSRFFDAELSVLRDQVKQRPWIALTVLVLGGLYYSVSYYRKRSLKIRGILKKHFQEVAEFELEQASNLIEEIMRSHGTSCQQALEAWVRPLLREKTYRIERELRAIARELGRSA